MTRSDRQRRPARPVHLGARLATSTVLLAASLGSPVQAQSTGDPAAARALFAEGRQLAGQHKYDLACPKFEESLRLEYGVGTLFNLADCFEHIGRTASAWARFLDATAGARAAGQAERERLAHERAAQLEPKLSRLTIDVKAQDAGLEVKRDGQPVGRAAFGTAVPVDPGPHAIEAAAPGKKAWTTRVQVAPNAANVAVTVPPLQDNPTAPKPLPAAPPPAGTPSIAGFGSSGATAGSTPPPTDTSEKPTGGDSGGTQKAIGLVVVGAGVVGVAVGTAFFLSYKSKNDSAIGICAGDAASSCDPGDKSHHDSLVEDAKRARTAGFISAGIGGAALATGAILFFTAPSASNAGFTAAPLVAEGVVGAVLRRNW